MLEPRAFKREPPESRAHLREGLKVEEMVLGYVEWFCFPRFFVSLFFHLFQLFFFSSFQSCGASLFVAPLPNPSVSLSPICSLPFFFLLSLLPVLFSPSISRPVFPPPRLSGVNGEGNGGRSRYLFVLTAILWSQSY